MWCWHTRILFGPKKGGSSNMLQHEKSYYAKWNKQVTKRQVLYDST